MKGPGRALIATGVAALTGGALVFTSSVLPATMPTLEVVRPVNYAANTAPGTAAERPTAEDVKAALTLIGQLGPGVDTPTVHPLDSATAAPALPFANHRVLAALAEQSPQARAAITTLEEPVTLNAASDLIDGVYSFTRYWANYVSLELGPWLINWIPFGYLISDQIYIWYPNFVLATVDSFVYDFLDPVVNDPLNLAVWLDGIGDIINTAVTGVVNGIVAEIDYVLDFGWFPFPLPPLPDLPLLGPAPESTTAEAALLSSESVTDESLVGAPGEEAVDSDSTGETEAPVQKRTEDEVVTETETAIDEKPEHDGTVEDIDEFGDNTGSEAPGQPDGVADEETEPDDGSGGEEQSDSEDAEGPGANADSDEQSGDNDNDKGDSGDDAGASTSQA